MASGRSIVALCPYIKVYLRRHPEPYAGSVVAPTAADVEAAERAAAAREVSRPHVVVVGGGIVGSAVARRLTQLRAAARRSRSSRRRLRPAPRTRQAQQRGRARRAVLRPGSAKARPCLATAYDRLAGLSGAWATLRRGGQARHRARRGRGRLGCAT